MKKFIAIILLLGLALLPMQAQAEQEKDDKYGNGQKIIDDPDVFTEWKAKRKKHENEKAALIKEAQGASAQGATANVLPPGVPDKPANYPPYAVEDTFLLHSNPGATDKLYIDFTGFKKYKAFSLDGDRNSFTAEECLRIQEAWYACAEDFLPFTIDVTTEEPPAGWPGARAIMSGANVGGNWAYMGMWPDSSGGWSGIHAVCNVEDGSVAWMGTVISHEVGHLLGIKDHGDDAWGYYMGHGYGWTSWGAIMGYDSWSLGVWDDGDYPNANWPNDHSIEHIIGAGNPGVTFRPDDHGSDIASATPITFGNYQHEFVAEGIISQRTDVDYFAFTTVSDGSVRFSINENVVMIQTNLDVLARIHDSNGAVLYESNPLWDVWASFDVTLPAGDYYLSIDGIGQDHPDGLPVEGFGYSDYGILGYYAVYAQGAASLDPDVTSPTPNPMSFAVAPYALDANSIAMEASVATDTENGVEYKFICTAGGGNDSAWHANPSYTDTGLSGGIQYTYTVVARDTSANGNSTAPSSAASATTDADNTAPTPNSTTFAVMPAAGGPTSMYMEATVASDPSGVEYYFACTAGGGNDSGWQDSPEYEDTGLTPQTSYTYTVTASDKSGAQNMTSTSAPAMGQTANNLNLVLPANGGLLEAFTSQYRSNAGQAFTLTNDDVTENGWASTSTPTFPQEFVYSFAGGNDATLDVAVVHAGWADETWYSKDVEVWTSADGINFSLAGSATLLEENLDYVSIPLGGVTANKVKLVVTSGYDTFFVYLAEFQVYGDVYIPADTTPPTPNPMTFAVPPAANGGFNAVDSYGFETPDQGDGGFTYGATGSPWTISGGAGLSGPNGPWKCDSTSPDPLGDQFAFLQDANTISTNLSGLAIGEAYQLSFLESYRTGTASGNDLSVILDEGLGSEIVIYNNPGVTNNTWEARTTSQFVPSKTSYTLTFRTTNPLGGDRSTLVDGLDVSVASDSDTSVSMTATAASDPSGVEYYFTETSGNPGASDSGWQDGPSYTDAGLDPGTEYAYYVTARDKSAAQNTGASSAIASATTTGGGGCTATDIHIDAMTAARVGNCGQNKKMGEATVTIVDDCGNPVAGALVDVTFTGDFNETINNVVTDANGVATATTVACVKNANFTATVTDVTGSLPYDSNDDVTNSASN